jgi:hypothetical protein
MYHPAVLLLPLPLLLLLLCWSRSQAGVYTQTVDILATGADYKHASVRCTAHAVPLLLLLRMSCLQAGVHTQALDILAHGADYLVRCHNAEQQRFVVQIGDPAAYVVDEARGLGSWSGPDHMPGNR